MSQQYDNYIRTHCENVKKAFNWLVEHKLINDTDVPNIYTHDESKYGHFEYDAYDQYFYGGEKTEQVKLEFNYAWLHHIHANPHHWQHWVLINDDDGTHALEMPYRYVVEMICDWWSFSHKTGNLSEIFNWYAAHKEKMILHPKTKKLVETLLDDIRRELENENQ